MDPELMLVLGGVFALIAVPSILSAWADERPVWRAGLVLLCAAGLAALGWQGLPEGTGPGDLPDILMRVVSRVL